MNHIRFRWFVLFAFVFGLPGCAQAEPAAAEESVKAPPRAESEPAVEQTPAPNRRRP